jgi:erythromycin esterase-like protein/predicted phosphoribosyltransferase
MSLYEDRRHGGRVLATALSKYRDREDVVVLALPRGGVPVAFEVARNLNAPLDVFVVRKLGVPGHEELAMGALASGGIRVLNEDVVAGLGIDQRVIESVAIAQGRELERREQTYRGGRPPLDVTGRTVILIDDGLATGSTMRAAVAGLRQRGPERIVAGVPIAAKSTCDALAQEVDDMVCPVTPELFFAVGEWYADFSQMTDAEVRQLLEAAYQARAGRPESAGLAGVAMPKANDVLARAVADDVRPLLGAMEDFDPLLELVGGAECVLIGEATHGTHEFYDKRAQLTKRLILEKGFTAVAAEADWPDAYRVNRYVRCIGNDNNAQQALSEFKRFPAWMWRNTHVLNFVEWLRTHNEPLTPERRVGFYGLDLYSLHASISAVLDYLEKADPEAAKRARHRYSCFEDFGEDPQTYGLAASFGTDGNCEREVVAQLVELQRRRQDILARDGLASEDEHFQAEQNARVVKNSEQYYRAMFHGRTSSWNLRDIHMADTLDALLGHFKQRMGTAKVVVWAHNSHVGDARATEMGDHGEVNIGQLARERHPDKTILIGFSTYAGTVTAASDWGGVAERKRVRRGLRNSYEDLFHRTGVPNFLLLPKTLGKTAGALNERRLQRAIGVVYKPETERLSHYFDVRLPAQFEAIVHIDETQALEPLESTARWERGELPETYPAGV